MPSAISEKTSKRYELLLIFRPDISEVERNQTLEELKHHLKGHGKGVFFEDHWGLRRFAYRMKKYDEGFYVVLYFDVEPEAIFETRESMKLNPHVLRHLLLTLPPQYEVKSLQEIELMAKRMVSKKEKAAKEKERVVKPGLKEVVKEIMEETPEEKLLQGKTEEEKLKAVDKTLDSILENPDISL